MFKGKGGQEISAAKDCAIVRAILLPMSIAWLQVFYHTCRTMKRPISVSISFASQIFYAGAKTIVATATSGAGT
jgi:hypothetical protein